MVDNIQDVGSRMGENTGQTVANKAQQIKDTAVQYGRQGYQYAAEKSTQARQSTESLIRDNPWYAIGIAVGAGMLLGALLMSRRD